MTCSQGHFPKWQLPKGIFPSDSFLNVKFPKLQLPKSVLATALCPLAYPSSSARLGSAKPYIWEVAAWEIADLGNCHLENRPWENVFGKTPP